MRSSAALTAMIPDRWPYAPAGARIQLTPPETFAGDWGGRWSFTAKIAYVNSSLDDVILPAVCAHELAHGRWSAPLPDLPGEEGSTALVLVMFDELRTNRFAIAAQPSILPDLQLWARRNLGTTLHIDNSRGAALAFGYLAGFAAIGMLPDAGPLVDEFTAGMGLDWTLKAGARLDEMLTIPAGATGDLVKAARAWDRWATLGE